MKVDLKIKHKDKKRDKHNNKHDNHEKSGSDEAGDSLAIFLSAVESQSYIELSTPKINNDICNNNSKDDDNDDDGMVEYNIAELPIQPSHRKGNNYNLGLQSMEKDRYLRFYHGHTGMLSFQGDDAHDLGGVKVKRYRDDDATTSCNDAEEEGDHGQCGQDEEGSDDEHAAITLYNKKFQVYLSINEWGMFVTSKDPVPLYVISLGNLVAEVDPTVLSEEDKEHFKTQGYIILKNAIPEKYVTAARKNINFQIAKHGNVQVERFPLPLRYNIFNNSPILWSALNILLGPNNVPTWQNMWPRHDIGFQLPVRFPVAPYDGEYRPDHYKQHYTRPGERSWHIDNPKVECPFNVLVGVALSDQMMDGSGCLYVYPGKHTTEEIKEYKKKCIGTERSFFEDSKNKPKMGEAVPVLLEKGDVVLAHASLPHSASSVVNGDIRYQIFFRVKHKHFGEVGRDWLEDPLKCFDV